MNSLDNIDRMRVTIWFCTVLLAAVLGLLGYVACLCNWITDYRTGYYETHELEAGLESGFIVLYTYLGVRFGLRHINMRL